MLKQTGRVKPKAISLFSGAGGLDLGVHQAGFQVLASLELDKHCCNTLRNWAKKSGAVVIEDDIRKVNTSGLRRQFSLKKGELDLLFGGPPCQSFSLAGKRGCLLDERGLLLFEMVRFAEEFKPKAILIEQVKGLLSAKDQAGKPCGVVMRLFSRLESLGYKVTKEVLLAANYGAPQLRERVFVIALRGKKEFSYPEPTHGKYVDGVPFLSRTKAYVTVGEALAGLPAPVPKGVQETVPNHTDVTPNGDRLRINGVPEGGYLANQFQLPDGQRKNLHPKKDTTKFRRLSNSLPSLTLRCGEIFFHPTENRYLTPREYLRIHGYPNWFILQGPIRGRSGQVRDLDQHRQVANSVPPPLAKAVAGALLQQLITNHAHVESTRPVRIPA